MRVATLASSISILLLSACGASVNANPRDFYAPKLLADEEHMVLVVPVEIEVRGDKKSFVKLFELYGFSGNGPSIEQVVKHNAPGVTGDFDSEGDAFVLRVASKTEFEAARVKLKCLEEIECLSSWLAEARTILLKE